MSSNLISQDVLAAAESKNLIVCDGMIIKNPSVEISGLNFISENVIDDSNEGFITRVMKSSFVNQPQCPCMFFCVESCTEKCPCRLMKKQQCCVACTSQCKNKRWENGPFYPGQILQYKPIGFIMKAITSIELDAIICPYIGQITTSKTQGLSQPMHTASSEVPIYVDTQTFSNCSRFIKTSCDQFVCDLVEINCSRTKGLFVVAVKNIEPDTEMLLRYERKEGSVCGCSTCVRKKFGFKSVDSLEEEKAVNAISIMLSKVKFQQVAGCIVSSLDGEKLKLVEVVDDM